MLPEPMPSASLLLRFFTPTWIQTNASTLSEHGKPTQKRSQILARMPTLDHDLDHHDLYERDAEADLHPGAYADAEPDEYADEHCLEDRDFYERYAKADAYPGVYAKPYVDAYAEPDHDQDGRSLYDRYADPEAEPSILSPFGIPGRIIDTMFGLGGGKDKDASSTLEHGLHELEAEAEAYPDPWDEEVDSMLSGREVTGNKSRFPYKPSNSACRLSPPHMRRYGTQAAPGNMATIEAQQQGVKAPMRPSRLHKQPNLDRNHELLKHM